MLEDAIILANDVHRGQKDKIGEPYILHPLRVMLAMTTEDERIVAVLHDTIEDTNLELSEVMMFGPHIVQALEAITHPKNEPYHEYLKRVKKNALARTVKIADIRDNSSPARLYQLEKNDILRLTKKYSEAMKNLMESDAMT